MIGKTTFLSNLNGKSFHMKGFFFCKSPLREGPTLLNREKIPLIIPFSFGWILDISFFFLNNKNKIQLLGFLILYKTYRKKLRFFLK